MSMKEFRFLDVFAIRGRGISVSDAAAVSMIATSALPAAFTFLFQRLDQALDRWRSDREPEAELETDVPAELVGGLQLPLRLNSGRLGEQGPALEILALAMAAYGQQPTLITRDNTQLLETLARVRAALEDVYGQRFTFQGETRGKSGPMSDHQYGSVAGDVTGLEAGEAIRGSVVSRIRAERVEAQGRITGMKAPVIEDRG